MVSMIPALAMGKNNQAALGLFDNPGIEQVTFLQRQSPAHMSIYRWKTKTLDIPDYWLRCSPAGMRLGKLRFEQRRSSRNKHTIRRLDSEALSRHALIGANCPLLWLAMPLRQAATSSCLQLKPRGYGYKWSSSIFSKTQNVKVRDDHRFHFFGHIDHL